MSEAGPSAPEADLCRQLSERYRSTPCSTCGPENCNCNGGPQDRFLELKIHGRPTFTGIVAVEGGLKKLYNDKRNAKDEGHTMTAEEFMYDRSIYDRCNTCNVVEPRLSQFVPRRDPRVVRKLKKLLERKTPPYTLAPKEVRTGDVVAFSLCGECGDDCVTIAKADVIAVHNQQLGVVARISSVFPPAAKGHVVRIPPHRVLAAQPGRHWP